MIYCEVLLSTSTRGRELKKFHAGNQWSNKGRPPREVVSWKIIKSYQSMDKDRRPPREVVSWKMDKIMSKAQRKSRPPREVVSWKKCSEEAIADNTCRSPREVVSWKIFGTLPLPASGCRSPREVVSWKNNKIPLSNAAAMSISTRGRELKKYRLCNAHNGAGRPPREVVSWKNFNPDLVGVRVGRPPREVVSWKMITNGALREVGTSTSTRGRELKMYYKMRVLKRILQTFLSYIHLYLRYTYRSWKTIKQK